ncbi:MAG: RHS repeat domain-containing protein, partial [Terricaulis sp.]
MTISRRAMFAKLLLASFVSALLRGSPDARAETIQYIYDAQGRVTRATFSNGMVVDYTYDNAGNRTQVTRNDGSPPPPPPPPSTFTQTIAITGTGPVNLRSLADAVGYNGAQNANVTYTLASGVTITGVAGNANAPNGAIALDTGTWPNGTYTISLAIQITGNVHGGGGVGGAGGVSTGGAGGDSIYCRLPISIAVNTGGAVRGGGGGGGGGASDEITVGGEPIQ